MWTGTYLLYMYEFPISYTVYNYYNVIYTYHIVYINNVYIVTGRK